MLSDSQFGHGFDSRRLQYKKMEVIMRITPLDIRKQEFRKSFNGYDKNEVDIFLEMTAKEMEGLVRENREMEEGLKKLDMKIEDYRRMEKTLQDTLTSAQKTTDEIRRNARKEADVIIRKAKIQANEILEDATAKVRDLMNQIASLKNQRDGFIAQLRGFLSSQIRMLDEMERLKIKETKARENEEVTHPKKADKKVGGLFIE